MVMPFVDLSGQMIGELKVVAPDKSSGRLYWKCECSCGRSLNVRHDALRREDGTRSCGCKKRRMPKTANKRHGLYATPENKVWASMIRRCHNPRQPTYYKYGGRGIYVCEEWRNDFLAFLRDMGPKPTPKHTIERKDNDGPYAPWNCEWATQHVQDRNKRNTVWLTANGKTMIMADWAKETGMDIRTISRRLKLGWADNDAINTPIRKKAA